MVTEIGHIKGLHEITKAFDKSEIALVLAVEVRKLHEYQCLKGKRDEEDILPYSQLEKRFGANRRTIIECSQGYKYRYPKGVPTKVQFSLTKPEREEEGQGRHINSKAHLTSALKELQNLRSFQDHQILPKLKYT